MHEPKAILTAGELESAARRSILAARNDADASAALFETLAAMLGVAAATMARGQGPMIDTLLEGANAHAHETAVSLASVAALIALDTRK